MLIFLELIILISFGIAEENRFRYSHEGKALYSWNRKFIHRKVKTIAYQRQKFSEELVPPATLILINEQSPFLLLPD